MKARSLGMVLLVLAMLEVPRAASAEQAVDVQAVDSTVDTALTVVGFGALDLGLTIVDLATSMQRTRLPRAYGGFETLAGGVQFGICLDNALSSRSSAPVVWGMGAGIGALLVVHGIVTLARRRSDAEAPPPAPAVAVAPLALSDIARTSVPGLAVLGRF
jgi:hypothetical protein